MAAYTQCLRCAGAPRRPAGGSGLSLPFLLGMPLSMTPGSSIIASPELRCRHGLRRDLSSSALPILPQSVSRGARISGLPDSRICYGLPSCSPPCTDQTDMLGPRGLPAGRSPSPLLDISTTATALLCWRDSHPLKWQLASLHQTRRAQSLPKRLHAGKHRRRVGRPQQADRGHAALLRAGGERPGGRGGGGERKEFAAIHSITSLARAMNTSDNETPRDAAVLRLTAM